MFTYYALNDECLSCAANSLRLLKKFEQAYTDIDRVIAAISADYSDGIMSGFGTATLSRILLYLVILHSNIIYKFNDLVDFVIYSCKHTHENEPGWKIGSGHPTRREEKCTQLSLAQLKLANVYVLCAWGMLV
jgi:hypothetical protein